MPRRIPPEATLDPTSEIALGRPFPYLEKAAGASISFAALCLAAGYKLTVTTPNPPRIAIHSGSAEFIAAVPGRRTYCFAQPLLPKGRRAAARYILGRMAYGAHDWAAAHVVTTHRRRTRAKDNTWLLSDPAVESRRQILKETLPLRRLLRQLPSATPQQLARQLGLSIATVEQQLQLTAKIGDDAHNT